MSAERGLESAARWYDRFDAFAAVVPGRRKLSAMRSPSEGVRGAGPHESAASFTTASARRISCSCCRRTDKSHAAGRH